MGPGPEGARDSKGALRPGSEKPGSASLTLTPWSPGQGDPPVEEDPEGPKLGAQPGFSFLGVRKLREFSVQEGRVKLPGGGLSGKAALNGTRKALQCWMV